MKYNVLDAITVTVVVAEGGGWPMPQAELEWGSSMNYQKFSSVGFFNTN